MRGDDDRISPRPSFLPRWDKNIRGEKDFGEEDLQQRHDDDIHKDHYHFFHYGYFVQMMMRDDSDVLLHVAAPRLVFLMVVTIVVYHRNNTYLSAILPSAAS